MKNIKKLYTITAVLLMVFMGSCQKDEVIGGTAVKNMSGEWWVQGRVDGALVANQFFPISTFNTAANSATEMWLDDGFWIAKYKVPVNVTAQTFTGTGIVNSDPSYDITINITGGKIIPGGAKGPGSKAVTDSIYFEAEYSDDPGTVYTLSGYKRTGFVEDDH